MGLGVGLGVVVAVVVGVAVAVLAAVLVTRSRRAFKRVAEDHHEPDPRAEQAARNATVRLTSAALQALPSPPWRVVYEVGPERLTGAEHVLVGPPGAFAVTTTIDPLPAELDGEPDAVAVARAAMTRGGLDDALTRVRLSSAGLVRVHWGGAPDNAPPAVPGVHGVTHVDGRRLAAWVESLPEGVLTAAQVDLAWQAVTLSIGRPDPLG